MLTEASGFFHTKLLKLGYAIDVFSLKLCKSCKNSYFPEHLNSFYIKSFYKLMVAVPVVILRKTLFQKCPEN